MHMSTLLVVEDDPKTARLMALAAPDAVDVVICTNADAAFLEASVRKPDVILLDITLPGRDGFALLQQLRQDPQFRDTSTIIVTGRASDEDKALGFALGASHYLTKPFSTQTLWELVTGLLKV